MDCDFLIIGAGIAGAAAGFALQSAAPSARTVLLEREETPGYHSTGRSVSLLVETYGPPEIRALTRASRGFYEQPPPGFADHPLLARRGVLHIARADQSAVAERLFADCSEASPDIRLINGAEARALQPVLRPASCALAVHEPNAMEIDTHALLHGFLRGFRSRGGRIVARADVVALDRGEGRWTVQTSTNHVFTAGVVINAAGAWADAIAGLAALAPLGLVPKRRTAVAFAAPDGADLRAWPMTVDIEETFYFKPDAGGIVASPADETPMPPCDVQPDEWDVALAVDRVERATTLTVRSLIHRWAGLRSFLPDGIPAVGPDLAAPGFIWLTGQGGYGIMTAAAMGRVAAAAALGQSIPDDVARLGITAAALSPARFGRNGPGGKRAT